MYFSSYGNGGWKHIDARQVSMCWADAISWNKTVAELHCLHFWIYRYLEKIFLCLCIAFRRLFSTESCNFAAFFHGAWNQSLDWCMLFESFSFIVSSELSFIDGSTGLLEAKRWLSVCISEPVAFGDKKWQEFKTLQKEAAVFFFLFVTNEQKHLNSLIILLAFIGSRKWLSTVGCRKPAVLLRADWLVH